MDDIISNVQCLLYKYCQNLRENVIQSLDDGNNLHENIASVFDQSQDLFSTLSTAALQESYIKRTFIM